MSTGIQWTDETWNPTVGCTRVSAGCSRCYAFELHDKRYKANRDVAREFTKDLPFYGDDVRIALSRTSRKLPLPAQYDRPFSRVQLMPDRLEKPLHWAKPRRIFVDSMSDLFHEDVPDDFIAQVYAVMIAAYWHIYQVLTKRPERRRKLLADRDWRELVAVKAAKLINGLRGRDEGYEGVSRSLMATNSLAQWNLGATPNILEGTSVEDQPAADERIPHLLATPAAVRFLSCEPLLSDLDIDRWLWPFEGHIPGDSVRLRKVQMRHCPRERIDWVIVGGESGTKARPFNIAWARSIRDQCAAAGVAFFMKQVGSDPLFDRDELPPNARSYEADGGMTSRLFAVKLHSRHGSDMEEWPEDLRIREFPEVRDA